jgi:hypothetical protein
MSSTTPIVEFSAKVFQIKAYIGNKKAAQKANSSTTA